jgi:hypothetical protein
MKTFSLLRTPRRLAMLGAVVALALAALIPATAFAQAQNATGCAGDVHCIITFGDKLIANRQASLTTLSGKITTQLNDKHITSDQASSLQAMVTEGQNDMTQAKTKLDADTTAAAARADVRAIFVNYRIYAVLIPKTTTKMLVDIMSNVDAKLRSLQPKIGQAIDNAGADKDNLNQLYADYKAQLSEAESQLDAAQGQFNSLTVANYDNDRSVFDTALKDLKSDEKTAHADLKKATGDLHQINQIVKSEKGGTSSGSSAPAATATPTSAASS